MRPSLIALIESFKDKDASNMKCVEIGVGAGDNAENMLANLLDSKFWFVDSYDVKNSTFQFNDGSGQPKEFSASERLEFIERVQNRLSRYNETGRLSLLVEDSSVAAEKFPDEYFDYVYIDAQHEYDNVLKDIKAWLPKVKKGGFLAGHDYGLPGVMKAINECFDFVDHQNEDWWVKK